MNQFTQNIRIALRGFRRTPTFAVSVVAILGLGIGTAVAMFTVFRAVLLERLPVRDAKALVVASTYKDPGTEFGLQIGDLTTIAADARTVREIAGYAHWGATAMPLIDGERPLTANRVLVTGSFFDVLGVRATVGRLLRPEDALAGAAPVLVLGYNTWQRDFGGDSGVVGRVLIEPYTQAKYTIVGVAPPGFEFPAGAGFWMPAGPAWVGLDIVAVARLAPGATPGAMRSELLAIKQRISPQQHLLGAKVIGFTQAVVGDVRPVLIVLMAAVVLLLIIACVNVGGLLLLRAGLRARELAIRRALGAAYGHIVRQLLAESGLLALGGGALGLVCAEALLRAVVLLAPPQLPRTDAIRLSGAPVVTAIAATLFAVLLFGVVPALLAARGEVATTLRLDSRAGRDSTARGRVRRLLVAAQTALALVMLAGAALLGRSLARLERIPLGYDADHLSILSVSWAATKFHADSQLYPTAEAITQHLGAIPGVTAVTPIVCPPMHGANVCVARLDVEGQPETEREANPMIPIETGGEAFFRVFGIPIRRGRGFVNADRENAPQVAVVSEAVARRFWPNQDPIGKRIHYWPGTDSTAWRTVVGVVDDVRLRSLRDATPSVFVPWRQINFWQGSFAVRTSGPLAAVLPAMRREVRAVDPTLDLWYAHPMDELLATPLAQPRMSALVMSAVGMAALVLATLGLYGLMASMVGERTREIGVRMALGATPERVRREVLSHALITCGSGALVGILGALAASRLLASQLFEVSATDPLSILSASALLLAVALIAAYLPARRATRIDPVRALREE